MPDVPPGAVDLEAADAPAGLVRGSHATGLLWRRLRRERWWVAGLLLILVVTAAVYLPNLDHELQYDDKRKLLDNQDIEHPLQALQNLDRQSYNETFTRLLPNLSLAVTFQLVGAEPFWYHLTNLLVHLLNVVLVFLLLRRVLQADGLQGDGLQADGLQGDGLQSDGLQADGLQGDGLQSDGLQVADGLALLAAGLFALHPLSCEAVSYCNARPNLMVVTFYLLTLLSFLRAMRGRGGLNGWWFAFAGSLVAALLCKELAVTVVVMAPLLLLWLYEGRLPARTVRCLGLFSIALVVVGLVSLLATGAAGEVLDQLVVRGDRVAGSWPLFLVLTVLGQAKVLWHYHALAVLPLPRFLNVDHHVPDLTRQLLAGETSGTGSDLQLLWLPLLCAAVAALVVIVAIAARRRNRWLGFFVVWPFLCHAPTSLVPRAEAMVEYRTYLPMVGVCLVLAWAMWRLTELLAPLRPARIRLAAAVVVLGLLAAATAVRSAVWATEISLWQDAAHKQPDNPRAHSNLGAAYMLKGQDAAAIASFQRALELDPHAPFANNNLGNLLGRNGDFQRAIAHLELAIRADPGLAAAHNNLGNVLTSVGRYNEAVQHYRRACELQPQLLPAWVNRCRLLLRLGRFERSAALLAEALQRFPDSAELHTLLGAILLNRGELDQAVLHLEQAVAIDDTLAEPHFHLANALIQQRRFDDAIRHYQRALTLGPAATTDLVRQKLQEAHHLRDAWHKATPGS